MISARLMAYVHPAAYQSGAPPPRVRLRDWRVNPLLQLRLKPRVHLPPKPEPSPSLRLPETQTNVYTLNVIAIICGLGVAVFVYLATSGLDMSVGFF